PPPLVADPASTFGSGVSAHLVAEARHPPSGPITVRPANQHPGGVRGHGGGAVWLGVVLVAVAAAAAVFVLPRTPSHPTATPPARPSLRDGINSAGRPDSVHDSRRARLRRVCPGSLCRGGARRERVGRDGHAPTEGWLWCAPRTTIAGAPAIGKGDC